MSKFVIDSDLLSDLLKGVNPIVNAKASTYAAEHTILSFTCLTTMEILSGLRHIQATTQLKRAEALFANNDEIRPEIEDYRLTAEIVGALLRTGRPIGFVDPSIAACAIRRGYGVATANVDHFDYIRQVGFNFHIENWRNP